MRICLRRRGRCGRWRFFWRSEFGLAAICFSLAALSKETAIVTPLALAVWESWRIRRPRRKRIGRSRRWWRRWFRCWGGMRITGGRRDLCLGIRSMCATTRRTTLTPVRVLLALAHRTMHVTLHMNLFVPVAAMLACLLLPAVEEDSQTRICRKRADTGHPKCRGFVTVTGTDSAGAAGDVLCDDRGERGVLLAAGGSAADAVFAAAVSAGAAAVREYVSAAAEGVDGPGGAERGGVCGGAVRESALPVCAGRQPGIRDGDPSARGGGSGDCGADAGGDGADGVACDG